MVAEPALKQKLTGDLKQAMRDKDKVKLSVIRLVMAAIQNTEIARQTGARSNQNWSKECSHQIYPAAFRYIVVTSFS